MKEIDAKAIIARTPQGWFGCDFNMNIYKGCCHGCIYCDSRSECYGIDNFDEVRAKSNAVALIESELKAKRKGGVIATGAMSDPYNPFEKKYNLTRDALKLVDRYGFGISPITKSDLITRDIDIYKSIKSHSPVIVRITATTFDDALSSKLEPHVVPTSKRLNALSELSKTGVFSGILLIPVLPYINDTEENVTNIIKATAEAGGKFIYPLFGVTLRQNQRDYFYSKLDKQFSGIKQKYINTFGNSYECKSPNSDKLLESFMAQCKKYGLLYKMRDIISAYRDPYDNRQMSFFESASLLTSDK
jgi:DNA repair photolyase